MSDTKLFVRKASGLVRAWSVLDAFIYITFSINLITLGVFIFSYCYYFEGNLGTAVVVGAVFTIFEVIVYASLISAMPRAGGDYVWQSRILGRAWGFWKTVTDNLATLKQYTDKHSQLKKEDSDIVKARVERILEKIENKPKSLKWKMRSKNGTKVKWYEDVDDLDVDESA